MVFVSLKNYIYSNNVLNTRLPKNHLLYCRLTWSNSSFSVFVCSFGYTWNCLFKLAQELSYSEKTMAEKPMWEQIGSGFVQHYYQQFDTDRVKLADLYVSELLRVNDCQWTSLCRVMSVSYDRSIILFSLIHDFCVLAVIIITQFYACMYDYDIQLFFSSRLMLPVWHGKGRDFKGRLQSWPN